MGVALGWLALALTGVGAAPPADREHAQITYTVRMVETEGVDWREAVLPQLKPVARQGGATVWTLPQDAITPLLNAACKNAAGTVTQAPKVAASSGTAATFQCRSNRHFVTQTAWKGAELGHAGTREGVRVGWHTTVVGRKLDQGILVKIVLEDTQVRAVHRVKMADGGKTGSSGAINWDTDAAAVCGNETDAGVDGCCPFRNIGGNDAAVRKVVLDVPEIASQEVLGEWLIPSGEALLVSFGAYTVADSSGKAVVKERLALVEAAEACVAGPVLRPTPWVPVPNGLPAPLPKLLSPSSGERREPVPPAPAALPPPVTTAPAEKLPMPVPAIPSRSLPQGVHADGRPAELPPLPADETEDDMSESDSAEPRPSPQTKKPQQPKPPADSGTSKTTYSQAKSTTVFLPSLFLPTPSIGFQFLLPLKPLSLRLPFGQRLEIEIYGRVVPDPQGR
jgi:hypothetical protein